MRANRDQLLTIHKREVLKGLLINKFKNKYVKGLNKPNLQGYIDNEVIKFLSNDRLSEDNLKRLDDKICREAFNRDRRDAIIDDRKSSVTSNHNQSVADLKDFGNAGPPKTAGHFQNVRNNRDQLNTLEMPLIKKDGGQSERMSATASQQNDQAKVRTSRRLLSIGSKADLDEDKEDIYSQVGKSG